MASEVNRIRNHDFRLGKKAPSHWSWHCDSGKATMARAAQADHPFLHKIRLTSTRPATAFLSQEVVCLPDKWYRVEASATCDLSSAQGGLVLRLTHASDDEHDELRTLRTDPVTRANSPHTIRAFFHAPAGVRRATISVGIESAKGHAEIQAVRFMRILEPEYGAHPLAAPVPSAQLRPPRITERVCICSATATTRPLTSLLRQFFGAANISAVGPADLDPLPPAETALLLPDATPPPCIRTFDTLLRLAESRYVVISLSAFAHLTRGAASVRRILQADDPTYARVLLGDHATCGFALHDAFIFAHAGGKDGSMFLQNHMRKTDKLARFCKKNRLVVMLESLCDKDATSHQPVALHRTTAGGGIYVIDLDPVESPPSSMAEPVLAMQLLLSLLGRGQSQLGQFFAVQRREPDIRECIREFAIRYEGVRVHDAELPSREVSEQLVTVGDQENSFGLPLPPRPVILIRSGLTGGDLESLYGCWLWIKQLVRPLPHACGYGRQLISKFRIAWVPAVAPWHANDGWRRSAAPPIAPTVIDSEPGDLAALIDVVSVPVQRVRAIFARNDQRCAHAARWLPSLFRTFAPQQRFSLAPPTGTPLSDRSAYSWRLISPDVEVGTSPELFVDPAHVDALNAGAAVIRLEVPGQDADWLAQSVYRTEVASTLLEQLVGLQYGLIAVNRRHSPLRFDGFTPVPPGEALIADHHHPMLRGQITHAG